MPAQARTSLRLPRTGTTRLLSLGLLVGLGACGSDQISIETGGSTTEAGTETGQGSSAPSPEQQTEIDGLDGELSTIIDEALAYFADTHSIGPDPEDIAHLCPFPQGVPAGGQAGLTPGIDVNCNEGPDQLCVPKPKGQGPGEYDSILWTANTVWQKMDFKKLEPHSFHYNFIGVNETTGYGACSFTAQAFGDLDDDAIFSTYERRGHVDQNGATIGELVVNLPFE